MLRKLNLISMFPSWADAWWKSRTEKIR